MTSEPMTPEILDGLADTDPLRLKNEAIYLLATVKRLRVELAEERTEHGITAAQLIEAHADAVKWRRVELTIRRAADHGHDAYAELLELAESSSPTEEKG